MKKDILRVFTTNFIKVLTVLVASFFIPKMLSVDEYASYKYFALISSYIGLLHFGFCDGVFLEYGGKKLKEIRKEQLAKEQSTIIVFELVISVIVLLYGLVSSDFVFVLIGLDIFPSIIITYYAMMYQATAEFGLYASVYNGISILTLLFNIILIFVLKIDNGMLFAGISVFVNIIVAIYSGIKFNKSFVSSFGRFEFKTLTRYSKMGILLTIGNVAFILFTSIDKWFVKGLLGTEEFAYYSFAVQFLSAMNMFINPVGLTLYSYLSRKKQKDYEYNLKVIITVLLFFMLDGVFVIKYIIVNYLPKYENAIPIIIVLFLAQVFLLINTTIYINLFKTYKMQKQYFCNLVIAIVLSAIFNTLYFFVIERSSTAIAYATLTCMIIWALINLRCFKYLKYNPLHLLFLLIMSVGYVVINRYMPDTLGLVVYLLLWLIIIFVFARPILIQIIGWVKSCKNFIAKKLNNT